MTWYPCEIVLDPVTAPVQSVIYQEGTFHHLKRSVQVGYICVRPEGSVTQSVATLCDDVNEDTLEWGHFEIQ